MSSIPPARSPRSPTPRRTRVPPALTRGPEPIPGAGILEETPGDLGVLLWRAARNVALWAATPEGRRGGLFHGGAAELREADLSRLPLDGELVAPLSVMVRLLESPGAMDVARVVNACRRISVWAEQRGALATALEFMQAAAQAAPQVAALAYAVGRLARRRAEYDRAESWFGRAVVQARRAQDWRSYGLAYTGLGNLYVQKGNFPAARRAHGRCLRTAERHGLPDLQGMAYHALFATDVETGAAGAQATELAARAFRAYGPNHPSVPRLAYDVAFRWIEQGCFGEALRVAQALEASFPAPSERALVLSLAAGTAEDAAARALLGVSYGAASLQDWALAERAAAQALDTANARREGKITLAAESALEFARRRPRAAGRGRAASTDAALADDFVRALRGRAVAVPA